jgi:hypothetical protein
VGQLNSADAGRLVFSVDPPQEVLTGIDFPSAVSRWRQTDLLTAEGFADKPQAAIQKRCPFWLMHKMNNRPRKKLSVIYFRFFPPEKRQSNWLNQKNAKSDLKRPPEKRRGLSTPDKPIFFN